MEPKTVMVVDDIAEQREIYTVLLRHHGYRVVEAASGEEALRFIADEHPDLVLLDMLMAGADGWAVSARLNQNPETARIPIIALTVLHSEEDQNRAHAAGTESYLTKPCEPRTMLREVQRFIGPAVALQA